MDALKMESIIGFKELEKQKLQFNLLVLDELLRLFALHEQERISRDELARCFEIVERYDWALLHELFDITVLAATGKIKNDSYYRAIKRNLSDMHELLTKQLAHTIPEPLKKEEPTAEQPKPKKKTAKKKGKSRKKK